MTPGERTRSPLAGAALLLGAAVIWGFAFVPQQLTVASLPPLTATAIRFCLAAPLALLVANHRLRAPGVRVSHAVLLGVLLFFAYALQTAGLVYAPVARVSLITGMYAVFVPLFAPLLGHARPTGLHWTGALLAFVGLFGLVGVADSAVLSAPLNIGDVFVLLHAVVSAFQVLLIGKLARQAVPVALNAMQLTTVMVIAIPVALLVDGVPAWGGIDARSVAAFAYLAAFSTVLAFTFQIFGQRHTSAPTAAAIMLLETPIGVFAAVVFVHETMSFTQWLGAAVLLSGVCVSLWSEMRRSSTT